jgi:uncharacterized membrane protein (DUF485 family)
MEEKLQHLHREREVFRTRLFYMMFEIALIFAIPAFTSLFVGRKLDQMFPGPVSFLYVLLAVSFVSSWVVVVVMYRKASKTLTALNREISEERAKRA